MFIAFDVLTERFLEEFRLFPASKLADVIRWCEQYCRTCSVEACFKLSTMDELFEALRKLPLHNFLNPGMLRYLAAFSKNKFLIQSVKNYEASFSSLRLNMLIQNMADKIQEVQVMKRREIIINSDEMVTKLEKKDLTVGELRGFTVSFHENILSLRVGINPPQYVKEGCVCIKWIIPSCLVEHAYNSACSNTELFPTLNLSYVIIGRYKVEHTDNDTGSMYSMYVFIQLYAVKPL